MTVTIFVPLPWEELTVDVPDDATPAQVALAALNAVRDTDEHRDALSALLAGLRVHRTTYPHSRAKVNEWLGFAPDEDI